MKAYVAEFFGTFWLVLGGCGGTVLRLPAPVEAAAAPAACGWRGTTRRRRCMSRRTTRTCPRSTTTPSSTPSPPTGRAGGRAPGWGEAAQDALLVRG